MNLNNDVVYRRFRLGPLHQRHPGRSRRLVRHHDRFHLDASLCISPRLHDTNISGANPRRLTTQGHQIQNPAGCSHACSHRPLWLSAANAGEVMQKAAPQSGDSVFCH
jgi:hypothetical protein